MSAAHDKVQELLRNPEALRKLRHDLMTPINITMGYSEMLKEELAGTDAQPFIKDAQRINNAAKRLMKLIQENLATGLHTDFILPAECAAHEPAGGASATPAPAADACIARMLVASNHPDHREMLGQMLRRDGYSTAMAGDPARALDLLRRETFDLVLLEMTDPETDALQLLEQLQANDAWKKIPIVVLASFAELDQVARSLDLGADDFLLKPFNLALLAARLGASLERRRLREKEEEMYRVLSQNQ